jgi:hypothetical protein
MVEDYSKKYRKLKETLVKKETSNLSYLWFDVINFRCFFRILQGSMTAFFQLKVLKT